MVGSAHGGNHVVGDVVQQLSLVGKSGIEEKLVGTHGFQVFDALYAIINGAYDGQPVR